MEYIKSTTQQRTDLMEKTNWTREFGTKEIENLAKYIQLAQSPKGMPVIREGVREAFMCIIVSGSVNVVKEDMQSHGKVLSTMTAGKLFGEMTLFDGEPRSATVLAIEDTTMLVLTKESLNRLIEEIPKLGAKILLKLGMLISQRLRMTSGKLVDYI